MYFVNRSKIDHTLKHIDTLQTTFQQHTFTEPIGQLALERLTHVLIESVLDVGNMMIDGFIMRDPGSYEDIIDILIDEKVLPAADETAYKALIKLRAHLVQDYTNVDHEQLFRTLSTKQKTFQKFTTHVQAYLDQELGVAHAFSRE